MPLDFSKFSVSEMFSNGRGKTSPGIVMGVVIVLSGCFGFNSAAIVLVINAIWKISSESDILTTLIVQSIVVIGMGATLLGIRRYTNTNSTITNPTSEQS